MKTHRIQIESTNFSTSFHFLSALPWSIDSIFTRVLLNRWFVFWFRIVSFCKLIAWPSLKHFVGRRDFAVLQNVYVLAEWSTRKWRWKAALIPVIALEVMLGHSLFSLKRIPLNSVGLTALISFSHSISRAFILPSSALLAAFFVRTFYSISSSCSLSESE